MVVALIPPRKLKDPRVIYFDGKASAATLESQPLGESLNLSSVTCLKLSHNQHDVWPGCSTSHFCS